MFKLFRFKAKPVLANPLQEKVASKLVMRLLRLQEKWAAFMDRKVNRLSTRSKKFGLMVFVGLSVLTCVSILIETFTSSTPASFKVQAIHSAKHFTSTGEISVPAASLIPEREYRKIISFHHYMDSLQASVSGRLIFDSINHCRPGLLDSAITLEKLYTSQLK
jgi:hypothetical protein